MIPAYPWLNYTAITANADISGRKGGRMTGHVF